MNAPVNRRTLATATAATALLISVPAAAERSATPAGEEQPWDKVARLGEELSQALNEYCNGDYYAEVHPAREDVSPVGFKPIRGARLAAEENIRLQVLMDRHRAAWLRLERAARNTDSVALGRKPTRAELREWHRANDAEEKAIMTLCSHRCTTEYQHREKARYLHYHEGTGSMEPHHFSAVLASALPLSAERREISELGTNWVEQMRGDGYVFVAGGCVSDLGRYRIFKGSERGDDTDILLREMRRLMKA